jgi:glutamyl-tRNA(Gln) amidotransferase subunit D
MPVAKVSRTGHVEMIEYRRNSAEFKPLFGFEKKVAIVKLHPGFDKKILEYYAAQGYRGIILEGTGLGHAAINETDEKTKHHSEMLGTLKKMSDSGIIIAMTSQCIFGKVNLNVYSTGRKLTEAGVLPASMTPETAYVKLGWVLANAKNIDDAKRLFMQNIAGENVERIDPRAFID